MNLRHLAVAAALVASSSSFAAGPVCTSSFQLNAMGPSATKSFGNSFNRGTLFSDCYDFNIAAPATAVGTTTEFDAEFPFLPRDIEVLTISLFNSLTGTQIGLTDPTTSAFSFSNLAAGGYKLVVGGFASLGLGTASYSGTLTTTAAPVASPVPEAPLSAMLAMAMVGAALVARRAKRS